LVEHFAEEMNQRWRKGERPRVEEYLASHPILFDQPEAALELLYEEIHLFQEHGQEVSPEDLFERFPKWQPQVQALLECHKLLAPRLIGLRLPSPGQSIGEFQLLAELGRGTQSRVFLATQPSLADRLVVLKFGPSTGSEHLSLARLQHTHIVPLNSVHDFPDKRLRALCLPYFGGATLDRLMESMRDRLPGQRTGRDVLQAIRELPSFGSTSVPVEGPSCRFLARVSYVQAVCWIGACLADALHYAHERGLLHLDLKPSNVLLAADGQPMLLDFHLARAPLAAGMPAPAWLGGTTGYMPPEQQVALDAVARRERVPLAVDVRADIYALGVLLYELLSGTLPSSIETPARSLSRLNANVTRGLADLVARCLASAPEDRYPTAAALADDLRRHLADLPLRGVANRSLGERWRKWRRRRRHAMPLLALLVAVTVALGFALNYFNRQIHKGQCALRDGEASLQQHRYAEALDTLKYGIALVEDLPVNADLKRNLHAAMQTAERGQAAKELHRFCESVRPLYSAMVVPERQARIVESHCRTIWQQRSEIFQQLETQPRAELETQIRSDLLDLAILAVHLRVRLAQRNDIASVRKEALAILNEAETLFGPSCVLDRERQSHSRALGLITLANTTAGQTADLAPRTAWEHCAMGLVHFREGNYRQAAKFFEHALELNPGSLWANFYRGSCAYHLGQYEDAAIAFSICVALEPQCAWCYANRGLAYAARGRLDPALGDYDRALRLDPTLGAAMIGRAVLYYQQKRYTEALHDLQRAAELGMDAAAVSYHRALVHLARNERADALTYLRRALNRVPEHEQSKALLNQLEQE
jgi:serine/threonine protein kinase/lipoprotein NlpI